jgi:hypothetical protein
MDRQQVAEPQHEVDLVDRDGLRAVEREEDDMHDAVGGLDLGALVALEHVFDDERVQPQYGSHRLDLIRRGRGHVDPYRRRGLAEQAGQGLERALAFELAERAVNHRGDADATRRTGRGGGTTPRDRLADAGRRLRG